MNFPCHCCGYLTIEGEASGTFLICPICFWEDDNVQCDDPTFEGGANKVSLIEAKRNFTAFGATEKRFAKYVRKPFPEEYP